jgi:hypothetical protein
MVLMPSSGVPKSPGQHRVYHRAIKHTPDEQTFINYLSQRGYTATLRTFQQEIDDQILIGKQK